MFLRFSPILSGVCTAWAGSGLLGYQTGHTHTPLLFLFRYVYTCAAWAGGGLLGWQPVCVVSAQDRSSTTAGPGHPVCCAARLPAGG